MSESLRDERTRATSQFRWTQTCGTRTVDRTEVSKSMGDPSRQAKEGERERETERVDSGFDGI